MRRLRGRGREEEEKEKRILRNRIKFLSFYEKHTCQYHYCHAHLRTDPSSAEVKNPWSYISIPAIRLHGVVLS
jgi:hypothetical protein